VAQGAGRISRSQQTKGSAGQESRGGKDAWRGWKPGYGAPLKQAAIFVTSNWLKMWLKQESTIRPQFFHRWYVYQSQSWVVYGIVLTTLYMYL